MARHAMRGRRGAQSREGLPSPAKAGEMLRHGEVGGKAPLSKGQKGLFGLIRGGGKPTKLAGRRRKAR